MRKAFGSLAACGVLAAGALPAGAAASLHHFRVDRTASSRATPAELTSSPTVLVELRCVDRTTTRLLRSGGAELLGGGNRFWRVRREAANAVLPILRLTGNLAAAEPDRAVRPPENHITSGDPLLPQEYWLAKIGADQAEPPGPGKPVTIVDTGIALTHPEFAGRPNTIPLNAQRVSGKDDDHGTGVASVVGAPANGIGLVGVYPQAVLQSWDASPSGSANLTIGDEVRAILTAAARGPGVVNLSLGSDEYDPLEDHAVLTAFRAGSIIVASAGNEGGDGNPLEYPASLNHVLTVGATDENDQPAFFSDSSEFVDLAAPGVHIPVAEPLSYDASGYSVDDGTSFSAPMVAGATAWVWSVRTDLDNTQIFELMRRSARDVGAAGFDRATGFGVLNIPQALALPALPPDPGEPNDDVEQVKPRGLFQQGARPLTSATHASAVVKGRLDFSEDPDDLYRVYVPPRRAAIVYAAGSADVDLDLWGPSTQTIFEKGAALKRDLLAAAERPGKAQERVVWTNRTKRGVTLYADVFAGKNTRSIDYAMTIVLKPAVARR